MLHETEANGWTHGALFEQSNTKFGKLGIEQIESAFATEFAGYHFYLGRFVRFLGI